MSARAVRCSLSGSRPAPGADPNSAKLFARVARMSRLHWIEMSGRLAIMARPRADDWLEVDVSEWRTSGVDLVVSLLEREEVSELGLQREFELCQASGIEFIAFPIPDRGVPDVRQALQVARSIANGIAGGRSIAVHCRAGIGRSSLIAACAMICSGIEAGEALTLIRAARGVIVPDTEEQRDWIIAFGKVIQATPRPFA